MASIPVCLWKEKKKTERKIRNIGIINERTRKKGKKKSNNQLLSESLHSPVTFKVYFFLLFLNNVSMLLLLANVSGIGCFINIKHFSFFLFLGAN